MKEVYRVESKDTGEMLFIAGCEDSQQDWGEQLKLLKQGNHPRFGLQKHFSKFGHDDMKFSVIKKVKDEAEMRKVILKAIAKAAEEPELLPEPLPEPPTELEPEPEPSTITLDSIDDSDLLTPEEPDLSIPAGILEPIKTPRKRRRRKK